MHLRRALAAVVACAGLTGAAVVAPALADDGAVHYANCPDTSFTDTLGGFTFEYCFSDTVTPSGNANAQLHGQLVDPATAPARATKVEGFGCFAGYPSFAEYTADTRLVVTPTGSVNGTCKFH
jgi:hypothetical protein